MLQRLEEVEKELSGDPFRLDDDEPNAGPAGEPPPAGKPPAAKDCPQQITPFGIITRGDIGPWVGNDPEPVPFVIADFVELGAVALLVGEGGAGKSYTALMAAISVAAGRNFYGKWAMCGRAVCLFAEDSANAIHARLDRLCRASDVPMENLVGRLFPVSLLDDALDDRTLWRNGRSTARLALLEAELLAIPDLRLLVLDCVAQMFDGDEISRRDVAGFLGALTAMARRLSIGIILIHHASKSQDGTSLRMASGSTAWIAQVRAAAELRKATEDTGPLFSVRKINNGREWEIDLKWTDDGALVPVAQATGTMAGILRHGHERAFLDCLASVTAQGRTVAEGKTSTRYAPKIFSRMPEAGGAKLRDLERAMETLFATGKISADDVQNHKTRKWARAILVVADGVEVPK